MGTKTQSKTVAVAEAAAVPAEPKTLTRGDLLAALKQAGYAGPTSFTATVLRDVVAWLEVGSPKDGAVPRGVLLAVHLDLRPALAAKAPRATAHQRGFREAVAAVDGFGNDLQAIRRWVADNTAQDVA